MCFVFRSLRSGVGVAFSPPRAPPRGSFRAKGMDRQELRFLAAEAVEVEAEVVGGAVDPLFEGAVEEDLTGDAVRRAEEVADAVEGKAALELVAEGLALLRRQFPDG